MSGEIRAFPNSVEMEKSILSSILQDPVEYLPRAIEMGIRSETFYKPSHAKLFSLLQNRQNTGEEIELVSLTEELMSEGVLETYGGAPGISEIYTYAPTAAHFDSHAKTVHEKATLRSLIRFCTSMVTDCYESTDAKDALSKAELGILSIGQESTMGQSYDYSLKCAMEELIKDLQSPSNPGIPTGWPQVDAVIGGLHPGEVTIIGARPGVGKTACAISLAESLAVGQQVPTALFAVEGSRNYLTTRLMAVMTRVSAKALRDRQFSKDDLQKLKQAGTRHSEKPLKMDARISNAVEIAAKIRRIHQQTPLKVVMIDYIQKLPPALPQERTDRRLKIQNATAVLHETCKTLGISLVLLAQLKRESPKEDPSIENLMESASLEQDADTVLLLGDVPKKDGIEESDTGIQTKLIRIAKNRHGPIDDVFVNFNPQTTKFFG